MSNFTDNPVDLDDSLACEPGGNQLVKKKKRAAHLTAHELMESIIRFIIKENVFFYDDEEEEEDHNLKSIAEIKAIMPQIVAAAQKEYEEWEVDENGMHWLLGSGGICQEIANAMADVLMNAGFEASIVSASIGEQHVYVVLKASEGIFSVDINPYLYETGGGYSWKKIPNVVFDESFIDIDKLDPDPKNFNEYTS